MKGFKKIILGVSLIFGLSLVTSCEEKKEITHIDMTEEEDEFKFSSIELNTDNVKKTFYLGEAFNYDGLVVKAYYVKKALTEETEDEVRSEEISTFTVNTEFVDMNTVGRYVVHVKGRSGMKALESYYIINVVTSENAESGNAYLAGLEVSIANTSKGYVNPYTIQFKKGETFKLPTITSYRAIYFKGTEISPNDCTTVNVNAIKVESSTVNTAIKGQYTIVYSLTRGEITVKSFVLVIVSDPVTSISFKSGNTQQVASVYGFDFSDWVFTLKEESGTKTDFNYNSEYITISDVNSLISGDYKAKAIYKDADGVVSTTVDVVVEPSTTQAIINEVDLSATVGASTRVKLGESNYFYANASNTTSSERVQTYDYIDFTHRYSLGGAGSKTKRNLEIYMPNAGTIVVYYGTSSAGTARALECLYEDGEVVSQCQTINIISKAIFDVTEAGRYYFYSLSGGMYIYGATIAYDLEGAVEPEPASVTSLEVLSGTSHYIQNGSTAGLNNILVKATFDDNTTKLLTLDDELLSITGLDITKVGNQTLAIKYDDNHSSKEIEYNINVTNVTLSKLEFISGATTQRASMGSMNVSDFKLKATYSDSSTKDLTFNNTSDYTLSYKADYQTIGDKEMNITFVDNTLESKEINVNITILKMAKDNISLNGSQVPTLPTASTTDLANDLGNGFSIPVGTSSTTDGKDNTQIADSNKSLNGFDFSKRINFRTTGNTNHNNINFVAKKGAKVVVYALASSTGKKLYLSNNGTAIYNNVSYEISTSNLTCYEFEIKEDGTYYLLANNSAYIFYVGVEYDQLASTDNVAASSLGLYTPYGENNTITVEVNSTLDISSAVLTISYSDGSISYLRFKATQYSIDNVDLTTAGKYNVVITYNQLTMTLVINVTNPTA